MVMKFEEAHAAFIESHLKRRSGERRGRLERGHAHAEVLFARQVWWPLRGSFDDLHPEYEVLDWRGKSYYADFAFSPLLWRILIEIKGFDAHVTSMDRDKYCRELNRELYLEAMGFRVISFAYDDVAYRPELCIHLLRMLLTQLEPHGLQLQPAQLAEKEVIRYAIQLARPIKPIDVVQQLRLNFRTAVKLLHQLCDKGWLTPVHRGQGIRVLYYELTPAVFRQGSSAML